MLNRPATVLEATRTKVELAAAELGYVPGRRSGEPAAHWRRNGFATSRSEVGTRPAAPTPAGYRSRQA